MKNIFTHGAISPAFIADSIAKHSSKTNIGGHSIFLGQVRADVIDDKKVAAIEYTTYEELALEKMHVIREETFAKYELTCMHVHHSLGAVAAGDICLFVFTSSAHRRAAAHHWPAPARHRECHPAGPCPARVTALGRAAPSGSRRFPSARRATAWCPRRSGLRPAAPPTSRR